MSEVMQTRLIQNGEVYIQGNDTKCFVIHRKLDYCCYCRHKAISQTFNASWGRHCFKSLTDITRPTKSLYIHYLPMFWSKSLNVHIWLLIHQGLKPLESNHPRPMYINNKTHTHFNSSKPSTKILHICNAELKLSTLDPKYHKVSLPSSNTNNATKNTDENTQQTVHLVLAVAVGSARTTISFRHK